MESRRPLWAKIALIAGFLFLYAPLVIIAIMSFNKATAAVLPLRGLTLRWYEELAQDERFSETALFSLRIALTSTSIACVLGTGAAFATARRQGRIMRLLAGLYVAPLFMPSLVLAVAMASTFRLVSIPFSLWTVTIGHVVVGAPLIYLIVSARLHGFDWSLLEAARTLGADPRQVFGRVLVPLIAPAVVGGSILAFAVSLDNFVVSLFLTGGDSTLPLLIWSMMREGFRPSINAMATLFFVGTLLISIVAQWMVRARR